MHRGSTLQIFHNVAGRLILTGGETKFKQSSNARIDLCRNFNPTRLQRTIPDHATLSQSQLELQQIVEQNPIASVLPLLC